MYLLFVELLSSVLFVFTDVLHVAVHYRP